VLVGCTERTAACELATVIGGLNNHRDDLVPDRGLLPAAMARVLPGAAVELEAVTGEDRRAAFPLHVCGALPAPADVTPAGQGARERAVASVRAFCARRAITKGSGAPLSREVH
jgi:hypothetical protein